MYIYVSSCHFFFFKDRLTRCQVTELVVSRGQPWTWISERTRAEIAGHFGESLPEPS